jgi:hypothetical protein
VDEQPTAYNEDGIPVWWFSGKDARLRKPLRDGIRPQFEPHVTITFPNPTAMRLAGLRPHERILNALRECLGLVVCRARLSGVILRQRGDNLFGTHFTPLWLGDARLLIHGFLCDLIVRRLVRERERGEEPAPYWWHTVEAKRRLIAGEMSEPEYRRIRNETISLRNADRATTGFQRYYLVTVALASVHSGRSEVQSALRGAMLPWESGGLGLKAAELDAELERLFSDAFAPH